MSAVVLARVKPTVSVLCREVAEPSLPHTIWVHACKRHPATSLASCAFRDDLSFACDAT